MSASTSSSVANVANIVGDPATAVRSASSQDGLAALSVINRDPSPSRSNIDPGTNNRRINNRRVLTEEDAYQALGYSFPTWKKWTILTSIFLVQVSMNFNAAIYGNAGSGLKEEFGVSNSMFKVGQMIFLVMYAFGCELWAPWSEELGRRWVMQGSLFLVNLWQIPCALAGNLQTILAFRALGGLSSAGGSVTLGIVADMWEPETQQYAVAYVVLSSVAGSVVAPIVGGFIETYCRWNWIFWTQLIVGVVTQAIHYFVVPETRSDVLLDHEAKRRRKTGEDANIFGPNEVRGSFWQRISFREIISLMWRPYKFLATEPIVCFLSLLSGFSDALIFTGLDSFPLVLAKWDFSTIQVGLSFIGLLIGYVIAYISFMLVYKRDRRIIRETPDKYPPERRLWWLLYQVPLEPIGLAIFGFAALGPPRFHWMVPLFGTCLIGIANFGIYMATIDYMVATYGPYSASATGGNGFARDLLAGIAALYTHPFYTKIANGTKWTLTIPTMILFGIGVLLCIPVYVFYFKGEWFRKRSPYACQLEQEREEKRPQRKEAIESKKTTPNTSKPNSRPVSRSTSRAPADRAPRVEVAEIELIPALARAHALI